MKEKVAIIGGGIAGLTTAYLLCDKYDITLFEKDNRLGGNAHTITTRDGLSFDIAVAVFGKTGYPNYRKGKTMDSKQDALEKVKISFLGFNIDKIDMETENALKCGVSPHALLDLCRKCMGEVGDKFEAGEYFLPELVMSGEIFKKINSRIKPLFLKSESGSAGKIVVGTPKGDIHHLGKDVFAVLAEGAGFEIHDLGVDVPPMNFIKKLEETGARILGVSMLLTTAFKPMQELLNLLEKSGMRDKVRVIIGGGVTTPEMAKRLNVDAQTLDAQEGVRIAQSFVIHGEE